MYAFLSILCVCEGCMFKQKCNDKGTDNPKMKGQSLSAYPHVDGKSAEVS